MERAIPSAVSYRETLQSRTLRALTTAGADPRSIAKADEGPAGFYILQLKPNKVQPQLPAGHYVFAVAVNRRLKRGSPLDCGQTVAVGTMVY